MGLRVSKRSLRNVSKVSQVYLKKVKGCFKGISMQFQRRIKEVARLSKESVKSVSSKFPKKSFKIVSRMFQ